MKWKFITPLLLLFCSVYSQKPDYSTSSIAPALMQNANAVIRLSREDITISSQRSMNIRETRIVSVLNEEGMGHLLAAAYHDGNRKVRRISANFYDAQGKEIKSYKRKDFKDESVGDGVSVFNDNRILYLDYTPIKYPFTMVFESETETSNTAFLPQWVPMAGYYVSTERSEINIHYVPELGFKFKEDNFDSRYAIVKTEAPGKVSWVATNLNALKYEDASPHFLDFTPVVYTGLEKFNLEGVDGAAKTWEDFGRWYYETLLKGTDVIPQETQDKVKALTAHTKDPMEIASIIYKYVQDRTRYVSIQVGIGGFKPMLAKDVDKLGYGDCKALTNYTRALLQVVGVPSYYTIVYAGESDRRGLKEDFVSVQGNHIILALPEGDKMRWLECTSQIMPFAFQGTFTDDRNVLMVTPDGGKLVKTQAFKDNDNAQVTRGQYSLSPDGTLHGQLSIVSTGSQYDNVFNKERLPVKDKHDYYKSHFRNLNNLKIHQINYNNDRSTIRFTEELNLSAEGYAVENAGKLMFVVNAFNASINSPKRYRSRENPFSVNRGFHDVDEITIKLPEGYEVEALPGPSEIKSKFGEYNTSIALNPDNTLTYKRSVLLRDGRYASKEYDDYRLFCEQISRNDNAKIVLTKK